MPCACGIAKNRYMKPNMQLAVKNDEEQKREIENGNIFEKKVSNSGNKFRGALRQNSEALAQYNLERRQNKKYE